MNISVDLKELKDSIVQELRSDIKSMVDGFTSRRSVEKEQDSAQERNGSSSPPLELISASTGISLRQEDSLLQSALAEIKTECVKIKEEVVGIKPKLENGDPGKAPEDDLSLRQVTDWIRVEVTSLRSELKSATSRMSGGTEGEEERDKDGGYQPPKKIQKLDLVKDHEVVMSKQSFLNGLNQEMNEAENKWKSSVAKSLELASKSDSVSGLMTGAREFYVLVVQITNLMAIELIGGETYRMGTYEPPPPTVSPAVRQAFAVKCTQSEKLEGVISYSIKGTNNQLIVYYYVHSSGNKVGLAVCPRHLPLKEILASMSLSEAVDKVRPDKQTGRSHVMVKLQEYIARAVMTWGNRSVLTVQIMAQDQRPETLTKIIDAKTEPSLDQKVFSKKLKNGFSLHGKTLNGIISQKSLKQFACVVAFGNGLSIPLTELSWEIRSAVGTFLVPSIPPLTREAFYTSDDLNMQGVFSYRIGNSDLRLALVFQIYNGGCSFAVAFIPFDIPTDFTLMKAMISTKEWKSRPDRVFSPAIEGEQVVEIRNLRARVSMSNGPKAVLSVLISTT